jgi:hypothetical protein
MIRPKSFADFEAVLRKLHAKLDAREVHAFYLGALTSTNLRLGPQQLLNRIFGDDPVLGDSIEDANEALQNLMGYWNTLIADRDRTGGVRLAPCALRGKPTQKDLLTFARRRRDEILWFVRGIDAGGGDPSEFGPEGTRLLEGLAQGRGLLSGYIGLLEREEYTDAKERQKTRSSLLEFVETIERIMTDLMAVSDEVRRDAIDTFTANAGRRTDDGARIARLFKIERNATCPCGSGKKYKKCCGGVSTVH